MKRNCIHIMTLAFMTLVLMTLVLGLAALGLGPAFAGGGAGMPEAATPAAEENDASPSPRTPLRLSKIDFQDTDEGGKLTLSGEALPGRDLYLFLDDQPIATVTPDGGGKWSFESAMKLDDGRHTLRADQYDQATEMLAARAIVTIQRAKSGAGDGPPGAPTPKATSP
jgi:hypothetical protein